MMIAVVFGWKVQLYMNVHARKMFFDSLYDDDNNDNCHKGKDEWLSLRKVPFVILSSNGNGGLFRKPKSNAIVSVLWHSDHDYIEWNDNDDNKDGSYGGSGGGSTADPASRNNGVWCLLSNSVPNLGRRIGDGILVQVGTRIDIASRSSSSSSITMMNSTTTTTTTTNNDDDFDVWDERCGCTRTSTQEKMLSSSIWWWSWQQQQWPGE